MEINLKQLSTQTTAGTTDVKKMRLSENATSMVFQLFSKNIYSNPIGTVVREITSNCFDSHVEAKVNKPVIIKKSHDKETDTTYISFIDFGVGMSPERMEQVYGTFFESTKRSDNTQIGGFGIGGKTPLAYKRSTGHGEGEYDNSYYVITIFNKTKYYYCVYEGAETPEYSLLHSEATAEGNGTEVRIPVLERDIDTFKKEMVRQLYYFENIIFEGFELDENAYNSRYDNIITNTYQIVRGNSFMFRGTEYANEIHVCLGRVAYPIDYSVLGLSSSDYRLPVALRLEVGDVNVTASRETLDYNERTIKILKKKLDEVKVEISGLISKQYSNITTLEQYFQVKNEFGVLNFANGTSVNVSSLITAKDIDFSNFTYSFMKMPNDRQLFRFFFETKIYGKKPNRSRYSDDEFVGGYNELKKKSNLIHVNGDFNRKILKQAYLKSKYTTYYIISRKKLVSNAVMSDISELFNVHLDKLVDDNGKPVDYMQSLIDMQEEYFAIVQNYSQDYDTLEVPEDFIIERKKENGLSKEIKNTSISVKFIGTHGRKSVLVKDLIAYNMPIIYGTIGQEDELENIHRVYSTLFDGDSIVRGHGNNGFKTRHRGGYDTLKTGSKSSIMIIILAQSNVKYMEFCKKAYKPEQFFNKLLYRKAEMVMSYFQTYEIMKQWNNLDPMYRSAFFGRINEKYGKKINEVREYFKNSKLSSSSIGDIKHYLTKYFNLSDIAMTAEQKHIYANICSLVTLESTNDKVLEFIRIPYGNEFEDEILVNILKAAMIF